MVSLTTISITVKDLGKALSFYRTLGLSIPEKQDNEPHFEYTSDICYSIGFISETTMLQTAPHGKHQLVITGLDCNFLAIPPKPLTKLTKNCLQRTTILLKNLGMLFGASALRK
ncbi:MAG: hypothetical protein RLZZ316_84 [Bacteroidota bacterium]|jgi:catechol 2,3-dioxygenase-like lactoylglutathione lyase family enzyme